MMTKIRSVASTMEEERLVIRGKGVLSGVIEMFDILFEVLVT